MDSMLLSSRDGGQSFSAGKQKYLCTKPPHEVEQLLAIAIQGQKAQPEAPVGPRQVAVAKSAALSPANVPSGPGKRKAFRPPGVWFSCELVGGEERIVWTPAKLVIMTKMLPKGRGLHKKESKFYTGRWSIEGPNVKLEWTKLPSTRLSTSDGGRTFHSMSAKEPQRYTCSRPPAMLTNLLKYGIEQAEKALEKAGRSKAGLPTDFIEHGCRAFWLQPVKAYKVGTLGECFHRCAMLKGMNYFALTHGDRCFCTDTPPGKLVEADNCDLSCKGDSQQSCGGFSSYASVYTMIDCLPPSPQKLKEDIAARSVRLDSLYEEKKSQSCGRAVGNNVEIEGSPVLAADPEECKQACLAGRGAWKCHAFTYDARQGKCSFLLDAFWGPQVQDPHFSCFFKKSIPLLA